MLRNTDSPQGFPRRSGRTAWIRVSQKPRPIESVIQGLRAARQFYNTMLWLLCSINYFQGNVDLSNIGVLPSGGLSRTSSAVPHHSSSVISRGNDVRL